MVSRFMHVKRKMEVLSSQAAYQVLKSKLNPYSEELWVMGFNSQMNILCHEMVFRGTANACPFHPRDIFRHLILFNACSYLIWHNHPSSSCLPSAEDLRLTRRLLQLSQMMQIPLWDHLIVSTENYLSLSEMGYFKTQKGFKNY
jgi:DNA repair protein RadC